VRSARAERRGDDGGVGVPGQRVGVVVLGAVAERAVDPGGLRDRCARAGVRQGGFGLAGLAAAGTPLAAGVQVTMCTSSPPPRRMTRDLMLAAGHSAASLVRGVAPGTSWVAPCAWAKASSAAGMSWPASWWQVPRADSGRPAPGGEHGPAGAGRAAGPGGVHRQQVPAGPGGDPGRPADQSLALRATA